MIGKVQTVRIAQRQPERGVGVLEMKGSIHAGPDCVWIEESVAALIQESKTRVIFDLSGVSHIESAAIGSIVRCLYRLRQAQGDLRLAGASCMVEGTLKITRLDRIIGMYPTVASADFLSLDASATLGPSMRRPIRVKSSFTLSKTFFFPRSAKPPCRHPSIRTRS